jgi:ADP-ribose pyrophosphatase YjhB (NUDIX family)
MKVRPSILIIKNNQVLLMKYDYNGNAIYCLPGGNPDNLETCQQTVCRELNEELNIIVAINDISFIAETINKENSQIILHCVFNGSIKEGIPQISKEHTSALEISWVDLENLDAIILYPSIGNFIIDKYVHNKSNEIYVGKVIRKWIE